MPDHHDIAPKHSRCQSKDGHHMCFKNNATVHIHQCICDRTWEEKVKS